MTRLPRTTENRSARAKPRGNVSESSRFGVAWRREQHSTARPHKHPAHIRHVCIEGNDTSRAHPARGRPKLRTAPADPRNATVRKPCSRRESPSIPAQPASTKTGLSRRRSRVRVPSLPLRLLPAKGSVMLSRLTRLRGRPGPFVAHAVFGKSLQIGISVLELVTGRTNKPGHTRF